MSQITDYGTRWRKCSIITPVPSARLSRQLLHDDAIALNLIQFELDRGGSFRRLRIGCLDRPKDYNGNHIGRAAAPPEMGAVRFTRSMTSANCQRPRLPQSSSASRLTAGAAGFLNLSQSGDRPER